MKTDSGGYKLFWGDFHNHNAVGYAKGSLERSIEIAREHLDFFAFTGHASWHDMLPMPGERQQHWIKGFKAHRDHWPLTRKMIREACDDNFVAFLGYEWHSSRFGDYCLIFPGDQEELFLPDTVEELFDFAEEHGAFAIPHHVAYKQGWRGGNWNHFRPAVTPVVEIFSEQGCTLTDRSPYPMILHSNGARVTSNTVMHQLFRGLRFGFIASTDDHFGYPGAYGEGVAGVWAEELTPDSIMAAVRARRTVAATGDRVRLGFKLNGHWMGSQLPYARRRRFDISVKAPDSVESIELVRNGEVIRRAFPQDERPPADALPGTASCRIQYGWGPWSALTLERICRWDFTITLRPGRFTGFERCFQTGPFSEELRDKARQTKADTIEVRSFTSRKEAYLEDPTKSIVCRMEAEKNAQLTVTLKSPVETSWSFALDELSRGSQVEFTGGFTSESLCLHRLVFPREAEARITWEEEREATGGADWYYVRVREHNGQLAWSSPVWVG
jgi:hypothetical protein